MEGKYQKIMKTLQKIIKSKPVIKGGYWSINLLEDEGIKLFYFAQEAIQAYLSCFEILIKREIAFQVEEALEIFL